MLIEQLHTKYVHMKNAQVTTGFYEDGSRYIVMEDEDEEGYPNIEVVSLYLGAYGMVPPDDAHIYVKDEVEHVGLTDALMDLGLAESKEPVTYGPFNSKAYLVQLSATMLFDREEAR